MPWRERTQVADDALQTNWHRLMHDVSGRASAPRVLYIHVPFCANHCLFCGFYRNRLRDAATADYVELLLQELEASLALPRTRRFPIDAIYLGGGTPSALPAADLARIVRFLRDNFELAQDCEITLEGRILHFDDERIDASLEAGVNRVSIGVQSFDTHVRQQQGRRASRDEVVRFVTRLRDRGRATVVIDLMFGLPDQTPAVWEEDVRTCLDLAPDGVDLYALNVFPGTPLFTAVTRGQLPPATGVAEQLPLYDLGVRLLDDAGWTQVSNSHFARTTRERNRYNLLIKEGAETLAFGSGAGGAIGAFSYQLDGELDGWSAAVRRGQKPIVAMHEADALEPLRQRLTGDLERGRIQLGALRAWVPTWPTAADALLERWADAGLVTRHDDHARLTTAGRFWSTNLRGELLAALARSEEPRS